MLGLSLLLATHELFLTPSSQRQTANSLRNGPEPVPALPCDLNSYCIHATKKSLQETEGTRCADSGPGADGHKHQSF